MRSKPYEVQLPTDNRQFDAVGGLFEAIPDTVFFVKDAVGRYSLVNQTLVKRLGRKSKSEVLGRKAVELFPPHLASRIEAQDQDVVLTGKPIENELELHLYADGQQGWCLTWKVPLRNASGRIEGLAGISRDVGSFAHLQGDGGRVSLVLDYVRRHIEQPLPVVELAAQAGLSPWQLDQRVRSLFGISLAQHVIRTRIDTACTLLRESAEAVSVVALACGYGDQAAFTRQFRKSVGLTPRAYRQTAKQW